MLVYWVIYVGSCQNTVCHWIMKVNKGPLLKIAMVILSLKKAGFGQDLNYDFVFNWKSELWMPQALSFFSSNRCSINIEADSFTFKVRWFQTLLVSARQASWSQCKVSNLESWINPPGCPVKNRTRDEADCLRPDRSATLEHRPLRLHGSGDTAPTTPICNQRCTAPKDTPPGS